MAYIEKRSRLSSLLATFVIISLNACSADSKIKADNVKMTEVMHPRFRSDHDACAPTVGYTLNGKISPKSYGRWHVRIDREGVLYWNGSQVDILTLRQYLSKIREMNAESEFVSAEIEPGALCKKVEDLRKELVESRLCLEGRCTENVWNIKTPMVN